MRRRTLPALALLLTLLLAPPPPAAALDAEDAPPPREGGRGRDFRRAFIDYWLLTPDETRHRESARNWEVGGGLGLGVAQDLYAGLFGLLQKDADVNIDFNKALAAPTRAASGGFNLNASFRLTLFHAAFRQREGGSFGFSVADIDGRVDANASEDLLVFFAEGNGQKHNIEPSVTVSGAVFAEIIALEWKRRVFRDFYAGIRPAWYIPLLYIPKSAQTLKVSADGAFSLELDGGFDLYIPFDTTDGLALSCLGGFDLGLFVERPLFNILDLGLEIAHVPLIPAVLSNAGRVGLEGVILDTADSITEGVTVNVPPPDHFYVTKNFWVMRPLRAGLYALYRPRGKDSLVIRPNLGFSVLTPAEKAALNLGLETTVRPLSWLELRFFTGIEERVAQNALTLSFNWKHFGFYLRLDSRSQDYLRAWTLKGASLGVGWRAGA